MAAAQQNDSTTNQMGGGRAHYDSSATLTTSGTESTGKAMICVTVSGRVVSGGGGGPFGAPPSLVPLFTRPVISHYPSSRDEAAEEFNWDLTSTGSVCVFECMCEGSLSNFSHCLLMALGHQGDGRASQPSLGEKALITNESPRPSVCVLLGYGGRGSSVFSVTHERSLRGRQEPWNGRGLVPAAGGHFSENNVALLRNSCFSKAPPLGTAYRWTLTPPR